MNRDEAKQILALYRSEELDGAAPGMRDALELARQDPELSEWLQQNREFHAMARSSLQTLPVPADLKDSILAARKIVPLWRKREFLLAAAASMAVLVGGSAFWARRQSSDVTLANFQSRMLDYAVRSYGMDILTSSEQEVRQFLESKGAPADFSLPEKMTALPVIGGARLSWHNKPVSMICFKVKEETAYLFVVNREEVRASGALAQAELGTFYDLSRAVWSDEKQIYLLGAKVAEEEMRQLLM